MTEWKRKVKAANSKLLLEEITSFIEEGLDSMGVIWGSETHRDSFVGVIDEWLDEKHQENKIEQYKVVCDLRNNKVSEMERGNFILDVYFKQRNCINTTNIHYLVSDHTIDWKVDFLIE